jgi:threonine dehydrogenase-like Zn-dependent dehydrogenase
VSFEEATFIEPINTIVKAVQKARVAKGENVLILGCGPIGLQFLMVAKLETDRLLTSDPMAERRAKSLTLGAMEAFDPSNGKLIDQIKASHGRSRGGRGTGSCSSPCGGTGRAGGSAAWGASAPVCRQ